MKTSRRLRISGRVQGVFYRAWSRDQALELGLSGWVRNCSDGSVEMVICGDEQVVEAMIDRCRDGPPSARVDGIEIFEFQAPVEPGFAKMPTV